MTTKINADANGLTESVDTSGILEFQTNGNSAIIIGVDQNANFTSTGAITVPAGTTAQRPTPVNGMMRYNSNVAVFEVYANNSWAAANVTPAPTNTVAPVISGSAIVGQNLTCTTGTWSGSPSAYFYQWRANSTAIANATANVFTLTSTQTGANITCNVIAQNIAGNSSPATSNTLGPVIEGVTVSYLIVAGGGGGGLAQGGGGGAGGLLTGSTILQPANTYAITIGAGGAGATTQNNNGANGSNSTAFGLTAAVGGGGGASNIPINGSSGGSGGGANGAGSAGTGGAGTSGQGNAGGNTPGSSNPFYTGAGGGGAGAVGGNASGSTAGSGGIGSLSSISGTATYYAGGGGGGGNSAYGSITPGSGGLGGGGAGAVNANATSGTANTGGGGGGTTAATPGAGGSGVVIISYAGAQQFGGGVITSAGGNTIHTFTTSGSLVPLTALSANYLVVAGGGGGGGSVGGGGGGGGLLSGSNVTIDSSSTYIITVGSGGAGGSSSNQGANGANSSFSALANTAIGGGGGGGNGFPSSGSNSYGLNGGSGGGVGWNNTGTNNGLGTAGQGNNGGITSTNNGDTNYSAGGGGGAGQVGFNGNGAGGAGGKGGNGAVSSISGVATYYAGGGGGVGTSSNGAGGLGGGGAGNGSGTATSGTAATGGGGGGGGTAGAGGSGVVIISYPGSTPMMAGGNVTVVSNTVVHTFTSSGFLTPFVNMNNSLRFRKSASAFLNRTPVVAGNRQKFTWSAWVKGYFGAATLYALFGAGNGNSVGNQNAVMYFYDGNIGFGAGVFGVSTDATFTTNAVFRDPAAWYHVVLAFDTTQATNTSRMKLYVNGVQQTFSSVQYPSQNYSLPYNATVAQKIGDSGGGSETFDGYMAEVRLIDGQELTPYAFGNFNQYGVWAPVAYAGSYGTCGYYLPFNAGTATYAGNFNGSNQYLNLGGQSNFAFGTGDFTVEFWYYTTSFANLQLLYDSRPSGANGVYPSIYVEASTGIIYYYSDSNNRITGNALRVNTWYHIALSRSSGSTRLFINGVQAGSTYADSENLLNGSSRPTIGSSGFSAGTFPVIGAISNLRVVKGTAVYTGRFTPPTANLTAITNTQLLTLQNATIVDNSTNGFTITNSGTTTTGLTYPFGLNISQDATPQGNNWINNNIGGQSGSTLDYMTDVPTLTSATAANYCVLNILGASQPVTVTNANLTVSCGNGSTYGNIIGSMAIPSTGKYYFEAICTQNAAQATWGLQSNPGSGTNRFEWYSGTIYYNGTSTSGATYATNDVLALAIDVDGGVIYTYKNGVLQNTVSYNISALTLFPYFGTGFANTIVNYNANFGQRPFAYTPPTGYLPLNTFNM